MVMGAMSAMGCVSNPPFAGPGNMGPGGAWCRWLPLPDWSEMRLMTQIVFAQKASCAAASAYPPASETGDATGWTTPTSSVLPSDRRFTW